MANSVFYSPQAVQDLDEIQKYISEELCNPSAFANVLDKILKAADNLMLFPEMGASLSRTLAMQTEYRFVPAGNYMIFYRYRDKKVYIDRILYKRRDYMRILFDDSPLSDE